MPPQSPFRFPDENCAKMAVRLHEFESSKVAGPGSSHRCINDVLWTIEEALRSMCVSDSERPIFDRLLASMERQKQLMIVSDWKDGHSGHISRTAETLRLLGHTYEYWWRGRPGIDATRWEIVPKFIPRRDIVPSVFIERLIREISDATGNDYSDSSLSDACNNVVEGVAKHLHDAAKIKNPKLSEFQFRATRDTLLDSLGHGGRGSILAAGVGSGKTLAFMIPAMILVKKDIIEGVSNYGAHLFLYPRTALALDQFTKSLLPFAQAAGIPITQIHSEMSKHHKDNHGSVRKGIKNSHPQNGGPRLVICTLETLKRRIAHPLIVKRLLKRLKTVTMDEVHLVSGVQGAQVAMLLRRLGKLTPNDTIWLGASATIAKPEEHLGRLMGINENHVRLIEPELDEMVPDGVVHHTFIRPSGLISHAGALVNSTSLLIHNRRDNLSVRPRTRRQRSDSPKSIAFADNLELLSSWRDDFRENERTDEYDNGRRGSKREHPTGDDMSDENMWDRQQREFPYATRFQNPLQRRIDSQGGKDPDGNDVLAPVFTEWRGKDVCGRCKQGQRFELGHANEETMGELMKLVHRAPHKEDDAFKPFLVDHPLFREEATVGTMEKCPFLKAGACTWFPSHPVEDCSRIGNSDGVTRYDFSARATSRVQSSKSAGNEEAEDLADAVFEADNKDLHDIQGATGTDFVDLVFASPSLEVGVDLPNLTESIMTRAIRNIASYRQKAGRVGRESLSEAFNVTLANDSSLDLHYYRQPRKLVDRGRLEPVPLKERNEAVARSTAYLAVWDWLALNCRIPEDILTFGNGVGDWNITGLIQESVLRLDDRKTQVLSHINNVLNDDRFDDSTDWFEEARLQVYDELRLLCRPVSGYQFEPSLVAEPATVMAGIRHILGGAIARPIDGINQIVEDLDNATNEAGFKRRDIGFLDELHSSILRDIDEQLGPSTPDLDVLNEIIDEFRNLRRSPDYNDEQKNHIRRFGRKIEDLEDAVDRLTQSDVEISAFRAIEQYQRLKSDRENSSKSYYLSDVIRHLESFKALRRDKWFVSPEALFIHPHMNMVRLRAFPENSIRDDQAMIPMTEALHSFLPGMWTRRLPQAAFKVLARETQTVGTGSVLQGNLDEMQRQGLKCYTIQSSLPPPPGRIGNIKVVTPSEIPIKRIKNCRYVITEKFGIRVLDYDEGEPAGRENKPVRLPKTFTNRWLHIDLEEGEEISPYIDLDEDEKLVVTDANGTNEQQINPADLAHPFACSAFSSIEWHDKAVVTEYTFGLSRTLSNNQGYGSELIYRDGYGNNVAFGQKITTEGTAFNLKNTTMQEAKDDAIKAMGEGQTEWAPSLIRAFRSYLSVSGMEIGQPLSGFNLDDILSIILALWHSEGSHPLSIEKLKEISEILVNSPERLTELVTLRIDARLQTPNDEEDLSEDDAQNRSRMIENMCGLVKTILESFLDDSSKFGEFLPLWLHRSILMSFGVSAVTAVQQLAGGSSGEIGYGLTDESWKGESTKILIFDRAECGNGNVSVAKTFMHIPNIVRSARGRRGSFLPSMDYLSTLEEVLLPCPQHHSDILGMEYLRTDGVDSDLHKSMVDLARMGREIHSVGKDTWERFGLNGPKDGWKLPLLHLMRRELAIEYDIHPDDVTRSTRICWNGCPECIERIDVVQGGYAGMDYLDRAVLDHWFRKSREISSDYLQLDPDLLIEGESGLNLGSLHSLALDTQRGRIRSCMLPWTIGLDLGRGNFEEGAKIILRESDLVGLRHSRTSGSVVMGTPSTGVKRLLWFDLLMTAYLDLLGKIPEDRKNITLVYYDARDIEFDDIGIAPQLLESLREAAREDGIPSMGSLSNIIIWLARRGFNLRLCVDAGVRLNPDNQPVRDFLETLGNSETEGNILLYEREVRDETSSYRSMHKKILLTPIYALMGSANMTHSGTSGNEEIQAHVMVGDDNYSEVRIACEDTLSSARLIND